MAFFQCCKCGCAEDTALCHYWSARLRENEPLCSACDPTVAKWHGEFPRESFDLRHQREMERWLELSWVQPQEGARGPAARGGEYLYFTDEADVAAR
jgi:hypothetical protein